MSKLDNLLQQVDLLREDLISLEQTLVRIPSVNTGIMPTGNETPVCITKTRCCTITMRICTRENMF